MNHQFSFLLVFILLFLSCKDTSKKSEKIISTEIPVVSILKNPTTLESQTPRLFSNGKELFMSWVTYRDGIDHLSYASYKEGSWSNQEMIAYGKDWFTNWADFPVISENDGSLLTSYLQKSAEDTYAYDVKLNFKHRDSATWKKNLILHDDGTKTEHGFVSMLPYYDTDAFFITWLDGRNTGSNTPTDHSNGAHSSKGAMTLRGANIDANGAVLNDIELDAKICDCCQTSAAMTVDGPIVVYRDRSDHEIRDISIVRWQKDNTWTTPKSIHNDHWKIAGCPVNGPAVDALGKHVAVAWYTGANEEPKVNLVFSNDSGKTFAEPIQINTQETLGRVDVIMLNEDEAIVSWMEHGLDDTAFIQMVKVSQSSKKGPTITLTETKGNRATGFPQIELLQGRIFAAMTLLNDANVSEIKTVVVNINDL